MKKSNARKQRHGAFWEDRYHATAVETGAHLARCVVDIDFNMVRTGVVQHPGLRHLRSVVSKPLLSSASSPRT